MANTRIPIFNADAQTAYIDYEQDATDGDGRQVVVIGHPSVKVAVAEVASLDVGASSTAYGQLVRLAGSAQANIVAVSSGVTLGVRVGVIEGTIGVRVGQVDGSIAVHLVGTGGTLGVRVGQVDGSIAVHLVGTGGTLGVNVGRIEGTTAVFLQGTGGTLGVRVGQIDGSAAVHIIGTGGTLGVRVGQIDGSVAIHLVGTGGTLGVNVGKIDDNVSVKFASVAGTAGVNLGKVDGTIQVNVGKIDDVVSVRMNSTAGTVGVNLGKVDGTIQVKLDPAAYALVNAFHTASIFTVSGSTSGVSASGVTLVSPSAAASFKVFAFTVQTTGVISMSVKFTNGAGTSPTEFWRPLITAVETTSTPKGAIVAVTPPGYLFATGVSTTLAIVNDGSLIHYSVSYFKESA